MGIALVTGGSRGTGRATAILLAQSGFKVVVNYQRNKMAADEVVGLIRDQGGEALAIKADIADERKRKPSAVCSH